jgi:hypothetical protein
MKKTNLLSIVVVVIYLAVGVIAHAQQPGKIFRIGFLDNSTAFAIAGRLDASRPA